MVSAVNTPWRRADPDALGKVGLKANEEASQMAFAFDA